MKIKETINELTGVLMLGGFDDDVWKLQDILLLLDLNPKIAATRMIRMFSSENKHFDRFFSTFGYPERDSIQKRFRSLRDRALLELGEVIPERETYELKPKPKRKFAGRPKKITQ